MFTCHPTVNVVPLCARCLKFPIYFSLITTRKRSLRRLCFYRCLSVHGGDRVCVVAVGVCGCSLGGMHGCWGCAWLWGHAWLPGGVHGCLGVHGCQGACVVARGACMVARGACMVARGHAWLLRGMHGCQGVCMVAQGACMVAGGCAWLLGACIGYNEIRSMSRWYASYWNAFLS